MRKETGTVEFFKLMMILVVLFTVGNIIYVFGTTATKEIVIKDKNIKTTTSHGKITSKYLIFTEKNGVFENTDSWLRLKFDSSDMYSKLELKRKYRCRVYGLRIPFFSVYPNIIDCGVSK